MYNLYIWCTCWGPSCRCVCVPSHILSLFISFCQTTQASALSHRQRICATSSQRKYAEVASKTHTHMRNVCSRTKRICDLGLSNYDILFPSAEHKHWPLCACVCVWRISHVRSMVPAGYSGPAICVCVWGARISFVRECIDILEMSHRTVARRRRTEIATAMNIEKYEKNVEC